MVTAFLVGDLVVAVALMAAILLQTGYTPGMSGAFGGGFAQQGYGGKKQGVDELLSKITVILGIIFAVVTLILVRLMR
jgi:preprotein translocase subunit SecG